MRRLVVLVVAAAVMALGAFGGSAHAAKKITNCKKDKKLDENIAKSFQAFLSRSPGHEDLLEKGDVLAQFIEEGRRANPNPTNKTWVVDLQATCDGKKAATFTYDLALTDATATSAPTKGLGLNFAGDAILDKKKGIWLISALTVCDLLGQNPATPGIGDRCIAAVG